MLETLSYKSLSGDLELLVDFPKSRRDGGIPPPALALLSGQPMEGTWFDRTKEYTARSRGESNGGRPEAQRVSSGGIAGTNYILMASWRDPASHRAQYIAHINCGGILESGRCAPALVDGQRCCH